MLLSMNYVHKIKRLLKSMMREDGVPHRRYTLVFLAVAIGGPLVFFRVFPLYKGDGKVIDNGPVRIGYRYIVHFEEFSFQQDATTKVYRFSGIPSENYLFKVSLVTETMRQSDAPYTSDNMAFLDAMRDAQVTTSVTISEEGDNVLNAAAIPNSNLQT